MITPIRLVCGCGWSASHNCAAHWDTSSSLERGSIWRENATQIEHRVHEVPADWVIYDAADNRIVPTKVAAMRRMDFLARFTCAQLASA